jgi:hypothetical protein
MPCVSPKEVNLVMHHYRPDESDLLYGDGAPTSTVTRPTIYLNQATGATYTNLGGGSSWNLGGVGSLSTIVPLTSATTLVAADSGKTFLLNLATGFTVTLPANSTVGFNARFIVGIAPTTAYIIAAATADTIGGTVLSASGGAEDTEGAFTGDQVNFVANTALAGDRVAIEILTATQIWANGICSAAGGITITG